jgi:NAD(P)-dependent dehydrogenase (short-subunit alcohol dehydrogenase family)
MTSWPRTRNTDDPDQTVSAADLATCGRVLRALRQRPELCTEPASPAAEVPGLAAELLRALNAERKREDRRRDAELIETAGIRVRRGLRLRGGSESATAPPALALPAAKEHAGLELGSARRCYFCKRPFHEIHAFYDQLCPACGDFNAAKRVQSADMAGLVALVTGARVKIGYQVALKLLRAGAAVIGTTRFPHDAARRYSREADFDAWKERLVLHALDLRRLGDVERFTAMLQELQPRLDVLINNAAQTIRRPPAFYRHLLDGEQRGAAALSLAHAAGDRGLARRLAAELALIPLLPEDGHADPAHFPAGCFDADGQQEDRRPKNSWTLRLGEVSTWELLEVHAVNCLAPFLLIRDLEPLLKREPGRGKAIVNVSSMEGKLNDAFKTGTHPHTNMAKAALNMITRTEAARLAEAGIFMNSVDTGWVTNNAPYPVARAMEERGFQPPLDEIDGAARVCDPIFTGLNTGNFVHGKFLKDYRAVAW